MATAKETCRFCGRQIAKCGMSSHIHFKHLGEYLDAVRPALALYLAAMPDPVKQLPERAGQ